MNRNLYLAGIICFILSIIFVCLWIINSFVYGIEFTEFVAFPNMVVVDWVIIVFCEIILLRYFHLKKYKVAFTASLISGITFMVLYTSVFTFFKGVGSGTFINLIVAIHLIAAITFSFSLVFSKASERPTLKYAGILGIVVGSIVLSTHMFGLNLVEGATLNIVLEIQFWSSRIGDALILMFYILNFYQEWKSDSSPVLT